MFEERSLQFLLKFRETLIWMLGETELEIGKRQKADLEKLAIVAITDKTSTKKA